jgi:hypothetical protein
MGLSFLRRSMEDRTAVMTLSAYQGQPMSGGGEAENLLDECLVVGFKLH